MIKINNWEDLIALAKEQGLTPKEAWERIEKTYGNERKMVFQ